jgi:hypothetical protein
MDAKELARYVDHERWLLNSGLASDSAKNQLFLYGSIVHKDVRAVELSLDLESKLVKYQIYVEKDLLKRHLRYLDLMTSKSLWGLWRFRRMLRREGNLNFKHLLNRFVKEYCGPKWSVDLEVVDYDSYVDGFGDNEDERKESAESNFSDHKRSD